MNIRVAFVATAVAAVVAVCCAVWMACDLLSSADPVGAQLRPYAVGGVR